MSGATPILTTADNMAAAQILLLRPRRQLHLIQTKASLPSLNRLLMSREEWGKT